MSSKRFCLALLVLGSVDTAYAQSKTPLRLEKTIPMPDVQGRIDHMSFDAESGRLFVAALGNNTAEVIDIRQGKRVHSISGLHEPQGVLYLPGSSLLYVANGEDGTLRIFDGRSYEPVTSIKLGDDADNIRWDAGAKQVYVGYGSGVLAAVDEKGVKVSEMVLVQIFRDVHVVPIPCGIMLRSRLPRLPESSSDGLAACRL